MPPLHTTTKRTETPTLAALTALFLLSVYAAALLWVTGGFLVRADGIARWSFVLALATNGFLVPVLARWVAAPMRRVAVAFGLALLIYAACCLLAACFYDISFDGQTYHAQAILALAGGWNPFYDTLPATVANGIWVQHYSKGYEYAAYGIYAVTGNLECGKGLNGVLVVAAALVLHNAAAPYLRMFQAWKRRALVALTVLNPIVVFTLFTFYVDGQLALCLLLLLASVEIFRRAPRLGSVLLFSSMLILAELKFTALVYCVLAAAAGGIFLLVYKRPLFRSYAGLCLLTGALAVGWVGYNPYVRNISEKGHPFYPLLGKASIPIWSGNMPPSFEHKSSLQKLAEASFARSRNVHGATVLPEPEPKIPFTFNTKEWTVFKSHDVRMGGFGPLWSGALLLSAIAVVLVALSLRKKRAELGLFAGGATLLLILILIIPESWNARYVPQFWWLPVWTVAFGLRSGRRLAGAVSVCILGVLGVNMLGTAAVSVASDAILTREIRHQFAWLRGQPGPVAVPPHAFYANTARLNHAGIAWKPFLADTVQLAATHQAITLQNSTTRIFYQGAPYTPSPLFARLAQSMGSGK